MKAIHGTMIIKIVYYLCQLWTAEISGNYPTIYCQSSKAIITNSGFIYREIISTNIMIQNIVLLLYLTPAQSIEIGCMTELTFHGQSSYAKD